MSKKNLTVCFFGTYDKNFTSNRIVQRGLEKNGVKVLVVNSHTPVTRLDSEAAMGWGPVLKRIFRKWKIFGEIIKHQADIRKSDVLYVGYPGHFDVLIAWAVAKLFNKKLVFNPLITIYTGFVEEQGILNPNSFKAKAILFVETLMYKSCDLVLADTPHQEKHFQKTFGLSPKKIKVLPIGADDEIYPYKKSEPNKDFTIVYYGLYSPVHGVEHIIQAAEYLKNEKNLKFLMIGNGNTYGKDRARAEKLKLENIEFFPDMNESNALETLQQADIFLGFLADHPTIHRVIPNKVYQGIALGKTVLTADAEVIRGVFTDKKDVYLVKAGNAESIAEAIKYLNSNPKKNAEIAEAGYKLYLSRFTPTSVGRILKEDMEALFSNDHKAVEQKPKTGV